MEFIRLIRELGFSKKHSQGRNDDVFIDRLNYRYTVAILCIFAVVVTSAQYFGSPIHCWVPGHFTGNYERYAEKICWVSNTYNVPMGDDIPHQESDRKVKMLKYYQWTPFILLFQSLLFYLPRMIWRSMNDKSGLDLQGLINIVHNFQHDASKSLEKDKLLKYLITSFDRYVSSTRKPNGEDNEQELSDTVLKRNDEKLQHDILNISPDFDNDDDIRNYARTRKSKFKKCLGCFRNWMKVFCVTKGKRYGNFLLVLFIFVKILYVINSISQLFLLNQFLGNDFLILGIEVLTKVWNGDDWSQINRFPRVTLCDFRIREVGIVHRYTVQCVLSINLFNEKIFIFLWYWLCFISVFNVIDLITWSYSLIINSHERYMYIKRRLMFLNSPTGLANASQNQKTPLLNYKNKKMFRKFVNNYLKEDGVLALRLMSRNAHDLIVTEVISKLYDLYLHRQNRERVLRESGGDEENNTNDNINTRARMPINLKNTRINNNNNENIQFQIISESADKK